MAFPTTVVVNFFWDEEARVFVATSDDVPGLVTEAATFEEIDQKVRGMIPELFHENRHLFEDGDVPNVPIELLIQQKSTLNLGNCA